MPSQYLNPLCERYASEEMQYIFSDDAKFSQWRELWVALAESQKELGLDITDAQIAEMRARVGDINYESAARYERETRHDVMAHIRAFGEQCPTAAGIIHLGATSCYVGDNTDIIIRRKALLRVRAMLCSAIAALADFADRCKDLPCLAYTHFQAAQPTTLGKRATLWIHDFMLDLERLDGEIESLKLLGCKGTTGTAASFLALFGGDHGKVRELERKIAEKSGFPPERVYPVSGQTYSRKVDYYNLSALSGIAQSAHKFSNDVRLMSHLKLVDEPFESGQVGSSAMAYKRNPMRSERIASLARHVTVNALNPALTASAQWFERTLDDSANRRISIPEAFLAVDGILALVINIARGMTVYPEVAKKQLQEELPFMATENILMHCVKKGGDRQELHEVIRRCSVAAGARVKQGGDNNLIAELLLEPAIGITEGEMNALMNAENFTGRAKEQTEEYLREVRETLKRHDCGDCGEIGAEIKV